MDIMFMLFVIFGYSFVYFYRILKGLEIYLLNKIGFLIPFRILVGILIGILSFMTYSSSFGNSFLFLRMLNIWFVFLLSILFLGLFIGDYEKNNKSEYNEGDGFYLYWLNGFKQFFNSFHFGLLIFILMIVMSFFIMLYSIEAWATRAPY